MDKHWTALILAFDHGERQSKKACGLHWEKAQTAVAVIIIIHAIFSVYQSYRDSGPVKISCIPPLIFTPVSRYRACISYQYACSSLGTAPWPSMISVWYVFVLLNPRSRGIPQGGRQLLLMLLAAGFSFLWFCLL